MKTQTDRFARGSGQAPGSGERADGPLLVAEGLGITYRAGGREVEAVREVSFEMRADERLMIVGPSGCGKSTLLRTVAGFRKPTSGRVVFDGRDDLQPGPDRAMVFQEFDQLFPWQTVLNNVAYPLRYRGSTRSAARAEAAEHLARMGLLDSAGRYPHELSGGMKQRVAIARALALRPRLLLMDEPFGSLDAITRDRLQQEVAALSKRLRVAVLFVTHSIDEALAIGDRVLVLSPGPSVVRAVMPVPPTGAPAGDRTRAAEELRALLADAPAGVDAPADAGAPADADAADPAETGLAEGDRDV